MCSAGSSSRGVGAGTALPHLLNRAHLAAESLEALIGLRSRQIQRLEGELATWSVRQRHASRFASAARGDGGTRSDIDVFVLRPMGVPADDPS